MLRMFSLHPWNWAELQKGEWQVEQESPVWPCSEEGTCETTSGVSGFGIPGTRKTLRNSSESEGWSPRWSDGWRIMTFEEMLTELGLFKVKKRKPASLLLTSAAWWKDTENVEPDSGAQGDDKKLLNAHKLQFGNKLWLGKLHSDRMKIIVTIGVIKYWNGTNFATFEIYKRLWAACSSWIYSEQGFVPDDLQVLFHLSYSVVLTAFVKPRKTLVMQTHTLNMQSPN